MASIASSTVTMPITCPLPSTTGTASRSYLEMSRIASSRGASAPVVIGLRAGAAVSTPACGSAEMSRRKGTA